jgi:hemolysin activation/secretion protein
MVIGLAALPPVARAQQSNSSATDASKIEQRIERPSAPYSPPTLVTPPAPPHPPAAAPAQPFTLVGAEITGSTVYTPAQLGDFYEPYLGRSISVAEVEAITKAITDRYHRDGYFLARAVAPPQDVALGILRIRVIEGYVARVDYKGAKPGRSGLFDDWAAKIAAERPLKLATLERTLLLMSDAPGLVVEPGLIPIDEDSGAYALEIDLKQKSVNGFATLDNRGTTTVGPLETYDGIDFNDMLGLLERTRLAVFTNPAQTDEVRYGEIYQEHMLTSEGTRMWLFASHSILETGRRFTDSQASAQGTRFTIGLSQSLLRSRTENLTLDLKADSIDSSKTSTGQIYADRLRILRIGADYNVKDGIGGVTWVSGEISKGFDILHASDADSVLISRTGGQSDFVKYTLDITRQQALIDRFALQIAVAGQTSPYTLLAPEEFSIGGRRFGRAYKPADISGSRGAAGYVELQYNPAMKIEPLTAWQLYGYYDLGAVWGRGFNRQSMASAGGGVRIGLPHDITGGIEVAQPLTRPVTPGEADSGGPRVFFDLAARF